MIFDYFYSYGGPELFLLFIFVVVTPKLNRWVLRKKEKRTKWLVLGWLWGASILVAYGDVLYIAWHARRLCESEGGLHVYRTVEVDTLAGMSGIAFWAPRGFRFFEMEFAGGVRKRYTIGPDSEVRIEKVDEFLSQYELRKHLSVVRPSFEKSVEQIVDRLNGDRLGELIYFHIYPGWMDRVMLGFLGFSWSPPVCGLEQNSTHEHDLSHEDLITAVIKPPTTK